MDYLDKQGLSSALQALKAKTRTSNPNLLINPDFKINQRGILVVTDAGAFVVDRWKLVSGNAMVNDDGSIWLNGTISQTLENAVGSNVTASVSAGTAEYEVTSNTFTITGDGVNVLWAKLEYGNAATPFVPPDPATELMKCCRYFQVLRPGSPIFGIVATSSRIRITMPVVCPMRVNPTVKMNQVTGDFTWSFKFTNAAGNSSFTVNDFSAMSVSFLRTDGSSIEMYINISHTLTSSEMVYTSAVGGVYFELDAEIK